LKKRDFDSEPIISSVTKPAINTNTKIPTGETFFKPGIAFARKKNQYSHAHY
jgi:hypothetical protein